MWVYLLCCAEDVVDEPVDCQTGGHIQGEPACTRPQHIGYVMTHQDKTLRQLAIHCSSCCFQHSRKLR